MLEASYEYLFQQYVVEEKSIYQIAKAIGTYPNKILRLLVKYNIPRRDKSHAQKNALARGTHCHPTKGRNRSNKVKEKISESLSKTWEQLDEEVKQAKVDFGKQQWNRMSTAEKELLRKSASEAVRRTATEGSKLERSLHRFLVAAGYLVEFHKEDLLVAPRLHIDIFLPQLRTAIEVDGPTHFYPIWGEANLSRHIHADNVKTGLLMSMGFCIIRIKHIAKNFSLARERKVLTLVLEKLKSIETSFPAQSERLMEIEIK